MNTTVYTPNWTGNCYGCGLAVSKAIEHECACICQSRNVQNHFSYCNLFKEKRTSMESLPEYRRTSDPAGGSDYWEKR